MLLAPYLVSEVNKLSFICRWSLSNWNSGDRLKLSQTERQMHYW